MGVRSLRAVVALVLLSLLAACGGGGDEQRTSADGTSSTTTTPDGGGSTEGGDGESTGAPSGTPTTGASGGSGSGGGSKPGTGAAGNSGGATGGTSPATTGTTSPPPPRTGNERTATPGTYTYSGTRDKSPKQGTLVVDPPSGADQRFVTTWENGDVNEVVVRTRAGGIDIVLLRTTAFATTQRYEPSPPVQFAPDPATVGATWSWRMTSTDGKNTLDGTFKAVRTERIAVGGEQVDTVVVEGTVQLSGDFVGTLHQTTWASPRYRLPVRTDERLDSALLKYSQSVTLTSTRPA